MSTIIYYGEFQHYGYCENWIADALDRNGHHCVRLQRSKWFDEMKLMLISRQVYADTLLLSKTPEILPEQLERIKKSGMKIIFWTFDWMRNPEVWRWYEPLAKIADICFQTDGYGEDEDYRLANIRRIELHQGIAPKLHDLPQYDGTWAPAWASFGSDLIFIGSAYTERRHELMAILQESGDFKKRGEPGQQFWGNEFAKACYMSKIVVGDNFTNDIAGYWSDRVYLTLGCGGFFLTAWVEGLQHEFENHKHLVWWKSFDELKELIAYYLPREAERRAIALEGYRLVQREHTYDHRVRKMTEALRAI